MRLVIIFLAFTQIIQAQIDEINPVYFYGDIMRNAHWSEHRSFAAEKFLDSFEDVLGQDDSFHDPLDSLNSWISIIYPNDSSLRVITWQVDLDNSFKYYGYVQFRSGEFSKLMDQSEDLNDIEYDILNKNMWYGALYYDIVKSRPNEYLLLGYDAYNEHSTRKIADILVVDDNEVQQFGQEIFVFDNDPIRPTIKTRILLEYANVASVRLSYDNEASILFFDNLIPVETLENPGGTSMVQDGSYSGYKKGQDGLWYYVDKLFHHAVDSPPRERPENDNKKDLFGKEKAK
jgi:hypothetical protein